MSLNNIKVLEVRGLSWKVIEIKSALKSTGKSLKSLEKSLNSTIFCKLSTVDRDLNQYKIVMHNNFILIFQYK